MTESRDGIDRRGARDLRLTLDVSLTPDHVRGTVTPEDGAATAFEGWLGLAQAVAEAGHAEVSGAALLGTGGGDA